MIALFRIISVRCVFFSTFGFVPCQGSNALDPKEHVPGACSGTSSIPPRVSSSIYLYFIRAHAMRYKLCLIDVAQKTGELEELIGRFSLFYTKKTETDRRTQKVIKLSGLGH